MFELHPQLKRDCRDLGRFTLCRLLLMNESRYPWFILVPERAGVSEIHQLSDTDRHQLADESALTAQTLAELFQADKMNIAAIGNLVPQLHIHHVVRYRSDPAWPAPVWGKFTPSPYDDGGLERVSERLIQALPAGLLQTGP
ncbi:HIT domain-containing protein [Methylococcus sp. EFPC2]|uniref:HIT domain-containing protein n=1 Tax=Methylococcus sp. EFPC2 TaxID=2812648 RepID=UPI00196809CB|nr:HIT domain-containing protein [Methylococcus sp. EFPC2]QSA98468.1 HIT domain-containing protein [Methylococcus sp. EFPC2]